MSTLLATTSTPSKLETLLAAEAVPLLDSIADKNEQFRLNMSFAGCSPQIITIPTTALNMLTSVLKEMAKGYSVALMCYEKYVSTQQAADILNVSRPFLIGLLVSGAIPCSAP